MQKLNSLITPCVSAIRHTESPIEAILFQEMMRSGKFVLCEEGMNPVGEGNFIFTQLKVGQYRADFIIRSVGYIGLNRVWPPPLSCNICIECDGQEYHSTPEQIEYDNQRDLYFKENGIKTIRFTGKEIKNNARFCVEQIIYAIHLELKKMGNDEYV